MTPAELRSAQEALQLTDEELAERYDVTSRAVKAWAEGKAAIPNDTAQRLAWEAALEKRAVALNDSGLPECEWVVAHSRKVPASMLDMIVAYDGSEERHAASCERCIARERFANETVGPLPEEPRSAWDTAFDWLLRLPGWARPAIIGAAGMVLLVSVPVAIRVAVALVVPSRTLGRLAELFLFLGLAAGAGAAAGLAWSVAGTPLRRFGRAGAVLTGIISALACAGTFFLGTPLLFGEPLIEEGSTLGWFGMLALMIAFTIALDWYENRT